MTSSLSSAVELSQKSSSADVEPVDSFSSKFEKMLKLCVDVVWDIIDGFVVVVVGLAFSVVVVVV